MSAETEQPEIIEQVGDDVQVDENTPVDTFKVPAPRVSSFFLTLGNISDTLNSDISDSLSPLPYLCFSQLAHIATTSLTTTIS